MTKIVRAQSVSNARGILAALAGDGYDIFRGQTHPWPPVPTLLRLKNEDRSSAIERLQGFFEWCAQHPRLSPYANDVSRLTAIAQHYGIPTMFLDVTTSVEVAVFFAL